MAATLSVKAFLDEEAFDEFKKKQQAMDSKDEEGDDSAQDLLRNNISFERAKQ